MDELFSSYFMEIDDAISIPTEQCDNEEREEKIASLGKRREMVVSYNAEVCIVYFSIAFCRDSTFSFIPLSISRLSSSFTIVTTR